MTYFETLKDIFTPLFVAVGGLIVVGGGLSTIVYWIFKILSERWLNAKFEERLVAYKHEQQKEIEQLRFKINALMDRTTKLHQREFDVLPEAWARMNDAYWEVKGLVASLQQYPDVNRMTPQHLDAFLAKCKLAEWEQDELSASSDKSKYYIDRISWHRIYETRITCGEFQRYLLKNGIFIPTDLKTKFSKLEELIRSALIEHKVGKVHGVSNSMHKELTKLIEVGPGLLKNLEAEVQSRLWNSELLL
jgi:hypothetical protein